VKRSWLARVMVTNRRLLASEKELPRRFLAGARRGGATLLVLREKDLPEASLEELARGLQAEAGKLPILLSGHPELAARAGLLGVHLGWQDPSVAAAREVLPAGSLVGISVHGVEEGLSRAREEPDYLFFGPINATPSKAGLLEPRGFEALERLCRACPLPVVAIGGLCADDEARLKEAGAAGFAAIRAFLPGSC